MKDQVIYHVCKHEEWEKAVQKGAYYGSSQDKEDGFIHFSSLSQVRGSVAKHRYGQDGLVLIEVDTAIIEEGLKWEPSRGGALFPHLYGNLKPEAVIRTAPLSLGDDGSHVFPDWLE